MTEQGREVEDIQHALRGSRSPSYKLNKNIARHIRYRMAVRAKDAVSADPTSSSSSSSSSYSSSSTMDLITHPDSNGLGNSPFVPYDEENDRLYQRALLDTLHSPSPANALALAHSSTQMTTTTTTNQQDNQIIFSSEAEIVAALHDASSRWLLLTLSVAYTNPSICTS